MKIDRHWYALYTRPRFERIVESELKQKGLESFLPLRSVIRYWTDRKKRIEEPLFPSYIFIYGDSKERYYALQSRGAIRMVSFNGQPARIPEEQIEGISRILEFGYNPEPYQYLRFGDEVEVVSGAMKGLRGFYLEDRGKDRLVISMHVVRQSLTVEIDRYQLKKVQATEKTERPGMTRLATP